MMDLDEFWKQLKKANEPYIIDTYEDKNVETFTIQANKTVGIWTYDKHTKNMTLKGVD